MTLKTSWEMGTWKAGKVMGFMGLIFGKQAAAGSDRLTYVCLSDMLPKGNKNKSLGPTNQCHFLPRLPCLQCFFWEGVS